MAIAPAPIAADATAGLDFGAAFAAALRDDNGTPEKKEDDPPAAAAAAAGDPPAGDPPTNEDGGASDEDAEKQKAVDDLAAAAATANGEAVGDEPPAATGKQPAAAPAPADSDSVTRLADMLAERMQPQQTAPQQTQPQTAPRQPTAEDFYSEEERATIAAYEKEWPDVARVEAIRRRGEYNMLATHIFGEFAKEMKPIIALMTELAARQQYADLKTLEPEYDELSDKVATWVDEMPNGILKNAYTAAITQGSAEDMQQLFDAYRKSTGATAPAPAGGTKPVAPKQVTELPPQTKQAVTALAPVSTRRSAQPAATPENFEDAFAVFAKATD